MTRHLQREIEKLNKKILTVSAMVEDRLHKAVRSISERNSKLADEVVNADWEIDQMEVEVEEDGLKILALYQPVAIDLRFIIAVLKINNDLERIGDLAVSIARQGSYLAARPSISIPFDFPRMAQIAREMVKTSIDALIKMDTAMASDVCARDDEIDVLHREMYEIAADSIRANPEKAQDMISMLSISRNLERIADHATNIAEDVIYMVDGVITRHRTEEYNPVNRG